jgi:hypothetical protein
VTPEVFAFNTFVYSRNLFFRCQGPLGTPNADGVTLENNIVFAPQAVNAFEDGIHCKTVRNNIFFPQPLAKTGNFSVDPKFVNLAAGDLHLQATSPGVNTALPSSGLNVDHDFDGAARPQGGAPDIGAFELAP